MVDLRSSSSSSSYTFSKIVGRNVPRPNDEFFLAMTGFCNGAGLTLTGLSPH
jgi:hypothetical protein